MLSVVLAWLLAVVWRRTEYLFLAGLFRGARKEEGASGTYLARDLNMSSFNIHRKGGKGCLPFSMAKERDSLWPRNCWDEQGVYLPIECHLLGIPFGMSAELSI